MCNGDNVHRIIEDILEATRLRVLALDAVTTDRKQEGLTKGSRDVLSAIEGAMQEGRVPVIAEVKPASPGKALRDITPADAADIAREMERAGAVAISVLTEPEFFHGSIDNLNSVRDSVSIPVLRKDFIIDEIQMGEAKSDLILLIAGALGDELGSFVELALSKGFEPLVEVHNEKELEIALRTGATLIGINNRDLSTLEVDLKTTEELAPLVRKFDRSNGTHHIIVSESGVHTVEDVRRVISAGADAILIGTAIIKAPDVFSKTKELVCALR